MRLLFLWLLTIGLLCGGSREALLVGNSDYDYISDLKNPKSSMKKLKKTLEGLGFRVKTAYNLDAEHLSAEVEQFRDRLSLDTIGFFYYSGHGCQLNHQSYLVPTNVDTQKATKIKYHALSIQEILDNLEQANNGVNMLFLDACHDVPTGTKGGTKGLGQIATTPKGTLIVYATEAGRVAEDSTIFIEELTKGISTPNKKIWEIGNGLSNVVATKTNDQQVPEMFSKRLPARLTLNRVEESRRVDLSTNTTQGITQIGNLMYQNQPFTKRYPWQQAKNYCRDLTLGGYSDWRLPTRVELNRISNIKMYGAYDSGWGDWFDKNKHKRLKGSKGKERFVREEFLENMQTGWYFWTSETDEKDSSLAWYVFFNDGLGNWYFKSVKLYALCIRGQ